MEEATVEVPKEEISKEPPAVIEEKESPKNILEEMGGDIQMTKISVSEIVEEKELSKKVIAKKSADIQLSKIAVRREIKSFVRKASENSMSRKASREEKEYFENGKLKRHMVLFDEKKFEGFWREYYTTGGIKVDVKLLLAKGGCSDDDSIPIEGYAREYHINGQLKQAGNYINNCEEGSHKYYSYEGLLEEELYYEHGKHMWTRRYNEDGLVISETLGGKLDRVEFYNK